MVKIFIHEWSLKKHTFNWNSLLVFFKRENIWLLNMCLYLYLFWILNFNLENRNKGLIVSNLRGISKQWVSKCIKNMKKFSEHFNLWTQRNPIPYWRIWSNPVSFLITQIKVPKVSINFLSSKLLIERTFDNRNQKVREWTQLLLQKSLTFRWYDN